MWRRSTAHHVMSAVPAIAISIEIAYQITHAGGAYSYRSPEHVFYPEWMGRQENIRNWRMWPPPPTHKLDPGVPVVALIWWESGPELTDTTALGWAGNDVYVKIKDIRWKPDGVWLAAKHVRRR